MSPRTKFVRLCAAVGAYVALWLLIPKASFLPIIVGLADAAMPHVGPDAANWLSFSAMCVMATPTVVFMAVQIAIVYYFAGIRLNAWQALLTLIGSLSLAEGIIALVVWRFGIAGRIGHYPGFGEQFELASVYYGPLRIPLTLSLIFAAASIGYLVSLRIRDKNLLLPVVLVAACVDFWTVTRGPVSVVLKHAPKVVEAVSAPIPLAGAGAFVPVSTVGPGDFLFMTLVFAVVHKLGMNGPRNYWFVYAAMTLGMLAVMMGLVPGNVGLPALVVLAVAVIAANWKQFKLSREEKISVAVVAAILLISIPIVWSVLGPHIKTVPIGGKR